MATRAELSRLKRLEDKLYAMDALESSLQYFKQVIDTENVSKLCEQVQEPLLRERSEINNAYLDLYDDIHSG